MSGAATGASSSSGSSRHGQRETLTYRVVWHVDVYGGKRAAETFRCDSRDEAARTVTAALVEYPVSINVRREDIRQ